MQGKLFKKYALIFSALIGFSLLLSGVLGIYFSYQENKQSLIQLQQEKAQAAAQRIGQYLFDLEQKISTTADPKNGVPVLAQRMSEVRLLRSTAALREVMLLDPSGTEVLRVSKRAVDVVQGGRDFSGAPWFDQVKVGRPYRSPIFFRDEALHMTIAMAVGPEAAGITVAEVDLEFLLDGITRIKVGEAGHAYAVDSQGLLIAHPDIGQVLKGTSLAALPQVAAALQTPRRDSVELVAARDIDGNPVLTAFGVIPYLGWLVFVEEPLAQAYQPLYAQAVRSALLVLAGLVLTVLACVALVRQMVKPIRALRDGAKLIGRGVFDHPIEVRTGDELEELANDFNRMAAQLLESYASLEGKVAQRTLELTRSEQSLREAQQIAGLGSYVFDLTSNTWTSSVVLDGLLGIDARFDRSVQGLYTLIHAEDRTLVSTFLSSVTPSQSADFDNVFRIIRHNDQVQRWVHCLGRVEHNAQGQMLRVHGTLQDITARKDMEDQVRQLAFYDPLTKLPNRRLLNDRLSQTVIALKRTGAHAALMFLDLDNFKPLNDAHGHAVGDLLLVEVAQRLNACVRKADSLARFGGDEFVVMLADLGVHRADAVVQAQAVAEKIRKSLSEPYRLKVTGEGNVTNLIAHHCSASVGVVVFGSHDGDQGSILKAADAAMYQAKAAGRNTIRFHAA